MKTRKVVSGMALACIVLLLQGCYSRMTTLHLDRLPAPGNNVRLLISQELSCWHSGLNPHRSYRHSVRTRYFVADLPPERLFEDKAQVDFVQIAEVEGIGEMKVRRLEDAPRRVLLSKANGGSCKAVRGSCVDSRMRPFPVASQPLPVGRDHMTYLSCGRVVDRAPPASGSDNTVVTLGECPRAPTFPEGVEVSGPRLSDDHRYVFMDRFVIPLKDGVAQDAVDVLKACGVQDRARDNFGYKFSFESVDADLRLLVQDGDQSDGFCRPLSVEPVMTWEPVNKVRLKTTDSWNNQYFWAGPDVVGSATFEQAYRSPDLRVHRYTYRNWEASDFTVRVRLVRTPEQARVPVVVLHGPDHH
jgi:hypothetical protein